MGPPPFILLLTFLLGPPLVHSQYQDVSCSCLDLAHFRTFIPDQNVKVKKFLHKMKKYAELDLCKTKWQDLTFTTLNWWDIDFYRPRRGKDIQIGVLLKKQAGEIRNVVQKNFWKNWLENHSNVEVDQSYNITWVLERASPNKSVEYWVNWIHDAYLAEIDKEVTKLETEWDLFVPNFGSFGTHALENRDKIIPAMTAFVCAWSSPTNEKLPYARFPPVDIEALEKMDNTELSLMIENFLTKWMKEIVLFQIPNLLKNSFKRLKPLTLGLIPHLEKFPLFVQEFQAGKQPKFENLIIRILEEAQTEEFLNRMDDLARISCEKRMEVLKVIFNKFLRIIGSEHNFIEKSGLDHLVFDKQWEQRIEESRNGHGTDIISEIFANLENLVENFERSLGPRDDIPSFLLNSLLQLIIPESSPRYCPEDVQLIKEHADMITAGFISTIMLKYIGY